MNSNYTKPRLVFLFLLFCLFYSAIIANLYRIQIKKHIFYANLAERQYSATVVTTPPRAPIFDRNGNYLALNKDSFAAFLLPKKCSNFDALREYLAQQFPQTLERLDSNRTSNFFYIKRKLSNEEIKNITKSGINDIKLLKEPHRFYPSAACASIIGLTDIDNKGILGLELHYDSLLSGQPTTYFLERDARLGHFYFKKETWQEGKSGQSITLTIDSALQFLVAEELKEILKQFEAKEGTVIVMDPQSGDILAMVSLPNFNPNNTEVLQIKQTKNKALSERYELGSVIKIFAALAALEEEVVSTDELIDCQNKKTTYIDGRKVNTVKAHGSIPFAEVIARSNNIGTATVVKRLDTKLYDHYVRLGFINKTNIPLPAEQQGFINHPTHWSKQSIFSLSYGYEIAITLLQLARAFCLIANNGTPVQPQLIKEPALRLPPSDHQQLYSQKSIDAIKDILEQTTTYGTARRTAIQGYRIMSKTGTANMLENGKYVPNKNLFTCAGIVQKGDYQRVIVAFVKESSQRRLFAATVAAPLFERVAEKVVIHDRII
ncbi:penicillin-binding protein 2 [Candidatus Dependentiae bacterium]|nr:MAG: penicillin-binding protein 2 [Candidatus Dependentiae bacterium]